MVAPVYTYKPVPPEAPSCATCKHYRFKKGFPIFGQDRTLCAHPKAIHKITGQLADAYMVRMASPQVECNVEGVWWEPKEASPAAVIRSGRVNLPPEYDRPLAPPAPPKAGVPRVVVNVTGAAELPARMPGPTSAGSR